MIIKQPQVEAHRLKMRDYQLEALASLVEQLAKLKNPLLVMPTGSGKTETIGHFILDQVAQGKSILFVVGRIQLALQSASRIKSWGIDVGIIQGSTPTNLAAKVQVASIDTLTRRDIDLGQFHYFILDEAHHAIAPKYDLIFNHSRRGQIMGGQIIGLTATPIVMGKYPKGHPRYGERRHLRHRFDCIVGNIHPLDLQHQGYLCREKIATYQEMRVKTDRLGVDSWSGDYNLKDIAREYDCLVMWEHLYIGVKTRYAQNLSRCKVL